MCAYKLITVEFRWWGLQTRVQNFIMGVRAELIALDNLQVPSESMAFVVNTALLTDARVFASV
jgi:hypothetical protein